MAAPTLTAKRFPEGKTHFLKRWTDNLKFAHPKRIKKGSYQALYWVMIRPFLYDSQSHPKRQWIVALHQHSKNAYWPLFLFSFITTFHALSGYWRGHSHLGVGCQGKQYDFFIVVYFFRTISWKVSIASVYEVGNRLTRSGEHRNIYSMAK